MPLSSMSIRSVALGTCLGLFALACADGGGPQATGGTGGSSPFTIAAIADQEVVRNTISPREVSVDVELVGQSPPSNFMVRVGSDEPAVVPDESVECTSNPCAISFAPSSAANAETTVTLEATAGELSAQTSFLVQVVPLLVVDRTDTELPPTGSLRDTITRATDGDVIGFDIDGQFAEPRVITLSAALIVSRSLTIEGPGRDQLVLDGGGEMQVFDVVSSSALTITDMSLVRGMGDDGGAVAVAELGAFRGERCSFSENQALQGGAIFADRASVELVDCVLRMNTAIMGGGVFVQAGTLDVDGTTFGGEGFDDGNTATEMGGAIAVRDGSAAVIEGSSFQGNTAGTGGGAVHARSEVFVVDNSTFSENRGGSGGGAIDHRGGMLAVRGSSFDGDRGSGPVIDTRHDNLEVQDSDFKNHGGNSVIDTGGRGGSQEMAMLERLTITDCNVLRAAISVGGVVTLEDIEISRVRSERGGAAMYISGGATVRRALFVDNEVVSDEPFLGEGGAIRVLGDLVLEDSELRGNSAYRGGGLSLEFPPTTAVVRNTVIADNVADDVGGGIFMRGEMMLAAESKVTGNQATVGGGLYVDQDAGLLMSESQIGGGGIGEGNEAGLGGGLFNVGDVFLSDVLVNANRATNQGGGIFHVDPAGGDPATLMLETTAFVINRADQLGGGIYVRASVTGSNNNFTGNTASVDGGAIFVEDGDISGLMGTTFALNDPNDVAMMP